MDDEALLMRALHDAHAPALRRYVVALGVEGGGVDDVVQETLVRAWRKPEVLDETQRSARAWLFTVARHLVIDEHRTARRRHERPAWDPPDVAVDDESDHLLDQWLVADALAALTPEHRSVVVRAYYGGWSVAQIASAAGIPAGTVKSRLHYGLRALRLALQEKGVTR
ncbi:RNA polymerase, sigma-24 subunit, ECF subfamily [Beutenbergia cavernae DSM 12333]|uniref:RNA polymerase sigma factor n=1 Tax=Beutenbergia cavernae (strain ATCC BAA-8 / DSM 12333 / CCUG 43141 / JCM 11478 / NBRC 16432 / NCIMB 13614 / HKI 0122) TaxID=471853 RepID=C5BVS0_BEUC1|nr:sigma-70 family RNA polymerase sigma factor [Beutenbergia cavernae]ACQ78510.1 RNA polymerase, sigma-24 subunit, ECF subfamily [Beutenbergia cavernae DSM 12333]